MLLLADPDRRLRDQLALRARRHRLHADLRRLRRAQPLAWRDHGRGRGRRLGAAGELWMPAPISAPLIGVVVGSCWRSRPISSIVRPLQISRAVREEEKEIFILTATLLWGIMIQELIAYLFTNNAKTVLPIVDGVVTIARRAHAGQRDLHRARLLGRDRRCCGCSSTARRAGKAVLAASMNPRGVTLLGIELSHIYVAVWAIYGVLAGVAGVLLGMFLGVSSYSVGPLTASAFSIVVLGGLGSVSGSLIAAYRRRLSRDAHRLSDFAGLSHHPGAAAAGRGDVCAPARPVGPALDGARSSPRAGP